MGSTREVAKCNRLLLAELGSVDGVHANFKWGWSESLVTMVPHWDMDGNPLLDYFCQCGKNASVHSAACSGLIKARTRFVLEKVAPAVECRWMLTRWRVPPPVHQWIDSFGTTDDYPSNGTYIPLSIQEPGQSPRSVILNRYVVPDLVMTWERINAIRHAKTLAELEAEWAQFDKMREDKAVLDEAGNILYTPPSGAAWHKTHDQIRDMMTVGNHQPGKLDHVSFPIPTKKVALQ